MITCWVALDDTQAGGGTIEHVRGSHLWPKTPPDRGSFHAPEDWLAPMAAATPDGVEAERVPESIGRRGGLPSRLDLPRIGPQQATVERRALVTHMVPVEARSTPRTRTRSIRATAAAAICRSTNRSSPCCGTKPAARSAWLAGLPELP